MESVTPCKRWVPKHPWTLPRICHLRGGGPQEQDVKEDLTDQELDILLGGPEKLGAGDDIKVDDLQAIGNLGIEDEEAMEEAAEQVLKMGADLPSVDFAATF